MYRCKKDKWLKADKICLAKGSAVAKNYMFEDKKDQELFLTLWERYLGNMAEIINYQLTPTSWILLFKTKTQTEIRASYHEQRKKSTKAKKKNRLNDASKMLSEHFRIFLSQYARKMNARNGRKGTLVLERFKKYVFATYQEYLSAFKNLREILIKRPQKRAKYQVTHNGMIKNKIGKEDVVDDGNLWEYIQEGTESFIDVLRKYFKSSLPRYSNINSS